MPRPALRRFAFLPAIAWPARPALAAATVLAAGALAAGGSAAPARASRPSVASQPAGAGHSPALPSTTHRGSRGTPDPYSPAHRHTYRRGVVASVGGLGRMRAWASQHGTGARAISASELAYGGGIDGIGVTTGHEQVYLVFWGSQWGTKGRDSAGDRTLSGDPSGAAPYLQELFKGLGRGGETWSGVATQYCQGIPAGATSCPAGNSQRVAYPTGGALAGVWTDEAAAAPSRATAHQIGAEAVRASGHFGNKTASANRNAQYLIVSPTGTHPDGFNTASGKFCGWHDWNGDSTLPGGPVGSPYGDIAFTNLPYVTDAGRSCGENFVNSGRAGLLDGVSIVGGHEYAETITDQLPAGGWTDAAGNELADLCQWNTGPGAKSSDLTLPTGTFAMQPLWANGTASKPSTCEFSSGGGGGGTNTITVTSPGNQQTDREAAVRLTIRATDSASGQTITYASAGLPPGLSIGPATGTITGRASAAGLFAVTVTASDTTGASGSASFTWVVTDGIGILARLLGSNPGGLRWLVLAHAQVPAGPGLRP